MFAEAFKIVQPYTRPIFTVTQGAAEGSLSCGNGTMVVVNRDGWFLTAAHMFDALKARAQDREQIRQFDASVKNIVDDQRLTPKKRRDRLARLRPNEQLVRECHYYWMPKPGEALPLSTSDLHLYPEHDLAVGRVQNFNVDWVPSYPVFKDPTLLPIATSLLKVGFPFVPITIQPSPDGFDMTMGSFALYPVEGIYSRSMRSDQGGVFIETTTAGLKGQSGGPTVDAAGRVWGIQVLTQHINLGFEAKEPGSNRSVPQFLNAGLGVHPLVLRGIMQKHGIDFASSE